MISQPLVTAQQYVHLQPQWFGWEKVMVILVTLDTHRKFLLLLLTLQGCSWRSKWKKQQNDMLCGLSAWLCIWKRVCVWVSRDGWVRNPLSWEQEVLTDMANRKCTHQLHKGVFISVKVQILTFLRITHGELGFRNVWAYVTQAVTL